MRQPYQRITEICLFRNLKNVPLLCQLILKKAQTIFTLDLLDSFNEYSRELKPTHRNWEVRRFCGQFKKLVPYTLEKRTGSGPREYQFPSTNECKSYFAEKYSLSSDVFEIN